MYVGARQIAAGMLTIGEFFTYTFFLGFLVASNYADRADRDSTYEALAGLERTHEILSVRRELMILTVR